MHCHDRPHGGIQNNCQSLVKDIDPFDGCRIIEQVAGLDSTVGTGVLVTQTVAIISVAVVQTRNHYFVFGH